MSLFDDRAVDAATAAVNDRWPQLSERIDLKRHLVPVILAAAEAALDREALADAIGGAIFRTMPGCARSSDGSREANAALAAIGLSPWEHS